jgi:hypothetical protein
MCNESSSLSRIQRLIQELSISMYHIVLMMTPQKCFPPVEPGLSARYQSCRIGRSASRRGLTSGGIQMSFKPLAEHPRSLLFRTWPPQPRHTAQEDSDDFPASTEPSCGNGENSGGLGGLNRER